jgi:hypothetical protein
MRASDKLAGRIIGPPKTKAARLSHHERMQKLSCGLARLIFRERLELRLTSNRASSCGFLAISSSSNRRCVVLS